jgi:hypothetical protein
MNEIKFSSLLTTILKRILDSVGLMHHMEILYILKLKMACSGFNVHSMSFMIIGQH